MARLSHVDYLRHLRSDSARFREVLGSCDPTARVPSCPDWNATDLLAHHTGVLMFWAEIIEQRPAPVADDWSDPELPSGYAELRALHEEQTERLATALAAADPAETAWSWSEDQTVGFTYRRQAHEALIHRLDAELTAGAVTPLDPALAADGVDEALAVMFSGAPPWGTFTGAGRYVRVDIADAGESVWVEVGRFTGTEPDSGKVYDIDDISTVAPRDAAPDLIVRGPAAVLDAWLWHRADATGVEMTGEDAVRAQFERCVDQPID